MRAEKNLKVLVVHHDPGTNCAYEVIARSAGWETGSCESAADVVRVAREENPCVLILDFSPETDFDALRRLRDVGFKLPVILITLHSVDHHEAMALGVKMILPKPPDAVRLRESLAALASESAAADFRILFEFLERCSPTRRRE